MIYPYVFAYTQFVLCMLFIETMYDKFIRVYETVSIEKLYLITFSDVYRNY